MKVKVLSIFVVLVLAFAFLAPSGVLAQAYSTSFTTSITYQNVGTGPTTSLQILFYASPSTVTPITITQPNLAAGASTSVFIGSVTEISSPFQGSAVMQADQPLLATLVQVPQNSTTVKVRPLSNGFSDGGNIALIATVIKNTYGVNTIFSIQNIDTQANNVNIKFYDTTAALVTELNQSVQAGASYYVDAGQLAALGASFNGSVVATATRTDLSAGKIVGSAMELDITTNGAKAFESVSAGATTIYLPSALCNYGATGDQNTSYAVQNTSLTTPTDVTVTYKPGDFTATAHIGGGAKASFPACSASGVTNGFIGSAVVTSTATNIIAMGKVYGAGMSTAFLGQASGVAKLSLPYVRWAPDANYNTGSYQRTFIAVQNVGTGTIPAGSITVTYTDSFGHTGTHTWNSDLAVGAKFSSNASLAGLTWFGSPEPPATGFGGGALINCTAASCKIIAIGRVSTFVSATTTATEDYNAMAVP